MTTYYQDEKTTIHHGDCLKVMADMPAESVDAIVTDPPYGLSNTTPEQVAQCLKEWATGNTTFVPAKRVGFMGKDWDSFVPPPAVWEECYRVLKPGGHLLAFAGSRTQDLMGMSVRMAGFEIRDSIAWLYGAGFSKGGLLGNKAGLEWCECGENALPYNHADNPDLHRMRQDLHPAPIARGESQEPDLFAPMQRRSEGQGMGEARPQGPGSVVARGGSLRSREDARGEESGLGGGQLHRTGEGLPHGADAGPPEGQGERLRSGASAGHGANDRASGNAAGGSASHQPGPGGQPTGEPDSLSGSHVALDDRALRGRAECARCGRYDPAFRGFSTTLKPAFEPVVVARKPLEGTVAANVLEHGTGALNVDATRIGGASGRWPANVVLDESQAEALDQQTRDMRAGKPSGSHTRINGGTSEDSVVYGTYGKSVTGGFEDSGGASRFFHVIEQDAPFIYCTKAPKKERPQVDGVAHSTVKPLKLMRLLVRLVTPPGGTVLDPFAGSGTTIEAALTEGFNSIGIELTDEYLPLIQHRIERSTQQAFNI